MNEFESTQRGELFDWEMANKGQVFYYVEKCTPPTSSSLSAIYKCNLIWKQRVCRYNEVDMRSFYIRVGPSQ